MVNLNGISWSTRRLITSIFNVIEWHNSCNYPKISLLIQYFVSIYSCGFERLIYSALLFDNFNGTTF